MKVRCYTGFVFCIEPNKGGIIPPQRVISDCPQGDVSFLSRYCLCWHFLRMSSMLEEHFRRLSKVVPRYLYSSPISTVSFWTVVVTASARCLSEFKTGVWLSWAVMKCGTGEQRQEDWVICEFYYLAVWLGQPAIGVKDEQKGREDTALRGAGWGEEDVRNGVIN